MRAASRHGRFPILLGGVVAMAAPAMARPPAVPFLSAGAVAQAPRGFVEMCAVETRFCSKTSASGDSSVVTGALAAPDRSAPARPALMFDVRGKIAPQAVEVSALLSLRAARVPPLASRLAGTSRTGGTSSPPAWRTAAIACETRVIALDATTDPSCPAPPVPLAAGPTETRSHRDRGEPTEAALLRQINRYVNARVRQETDQALFGIDELWRRSGTGPQAAGDCEDLAIEKRVQLIAGGFPADRLSFAVVYQREVGLHTVLVARLADGDFVLDSRTPFVERWDRVPYRWLSVQSTADSMVWHSVAAQPGTALS